jgi:hypothetical protein
MASPMVCHEISRNGELLNKACVADGDQLEAALAKLVGDRDPVLSVTVFSTRSHHDQKNISWQTDRVEVGDELVIRIVEQKEETDAYVKSAEDLEKEKESGIFCSFCGKEDREIHSMVAGKEGVFICNECVDLCVDINKRSKKLDR